MLKSRLAAASMAALSQMAMVDAVSAAGLGRIHVLSRMGQPFVAEIDVTNVGKEEYSTLNASLAPTAAYQAANLKFDPALNALRLSVHRRNNGTVYIRAASWRPVTEPYLDLMVDVASNDGNFRRHYAALLDLPSPAEKSAPLPASGTTSVPSASAKAATVVPAKTATSPAPAQSAGTEEPQEIGRAHV